MTRKSVTSGNRQNEQKRVSERNSIQRSKIHVHGVEHLDFGVNRHKNDHIHPHEYQRQKLNWIEDSQ